MSGQPKILVAGILDTKGDEIKFLAERVKAAGGQPIVMELSVGREMGWADISVSQLISLVGHTKEEVFALERSKASDIIAEGAVKMAGQMVAEGKADGIIAFGGSMGSSISTRIMQTLPVGVPKIMLSTMTSGDCAPYVGTKDICMMFPIAEAGLNRVTRRILNNGAAAVVGMAKAPALETTEEKPLIGCMMFGVTTPCVLRASDYFEQRGYDVIINHAVGSGGRSMEELIRDGYIVGMLDITTHEVGDMLLGGVLSAGPERLTGAIDKGVPQVMAPGGLDLINFGPLATVPERLLKETDQPGRGLYVHNPTVTCIGVSVDEAYQVGQHIAEKINKATAPTVMCIPMRGWGACDLPGPNKDLGWTAPGPGPVWAADPEKPEWSLRSGSFTKAMLDFIDKNNANLEVLLVDKHMNEPEFADLMAGLLEEMLAGNWKKGSRTDLPYVNSL
ncbi:MAG: Tm-1-like ATP-binding domain-containing protein [Firmicutes bacterium]|nr:Tm-1-like ATP-binding domain-containing protein [Bacillota bacterium]